MNMSLTLFSKLPVPKVFAKNFQLSLASMILFIRIGSGYTSHFTWKRKFPLVISKQYPYPKQYPLRILCSLSTFTDKFLK